MSNQKFNYSRLNESELVNLAGQLTIAACASLSASSASDARVRAIENFEWFYQRLSEAKAQESSPLIPDGNWD